MKGGREGYAQTSSAGSALSDGPTCTFEQRWFRRGAAPPLRSGRSPSLAEPQRSQALQRAHSLASFGGIPPLGSIPACNSSQTVNDVRRRLLNHPSPSATNHRSPHAPLRHLHVDQPQNFYLYRPHQLHTLSLTHSHTTAHPPNTLSRPPLPHA